MSKSIKVFAPATVANVTCGFDVLGFAIDNPGDEAIVKLSNKPGVRITKITGDNGKLPLDASLNTVSVAVIELLKHLNTKQGIEIILNKKMPLGSGLGSSAASSVVGVFAVNELLGTKLSRKELVQFALEGEKIASGSKHADNVAPALMGGFTLIRTYTPLDIIQFNAPKELYCTVIHPELNINTKDARMILKSTVTLKQAITQCGNLGGLICGLLTSDYSLIGRSMDDAIIEPIRSLLIPGFYSLKDEVVAGGALGMGISGSGPSLFALSKGLKNATKAGEIMREKFNAFGINNQIYVSQINNQGTKIIG